MKRADGLRVVPNGPGEALVYIGERHIGSATHRILSPSKWWSLTPDGRWGGPFNRRREAVADLVERAQENRAEGGRT